MLVKDVSGDEEPPLGEGEACLLAHHRGPYAGKAGVNFGLSCCDPPKGPCLLLKIHL